MATATKKCCGCKKRFKTELMIITPIGAFHSSECRYEYAVSKPKELKEKTDKFIDDRHKVKKKEYNANKLPPRKAATKKACHLYIRMRDKDKPCICCNEPLGDDFHAGHFMESGNNPHTRYDENNIHGQRAYCNTFKGGDSGDYENNLRLRIGDAEVDRLKDLKGGTVKRTADDYRKIEAYYNDKIKELTA